MHICKCTKSSLLKHQSMFPFPWLSQESDLKRHLWISGRIHWVFEWKSPCSLFPSWTGGPIVCLRPRPWTVSWEQCLPPGAPDPASLHDFFAAWLGLVFQNDPWNFSCWMPDNMIYFFRNADTLCLWSVVPRIAIKSGVSTELISSWRVVDGFHSLGG